jgi:hypothetical protein
MFKLDNQRLARSSMHPRSLLSELPASRTNIRATIIGGFPRQDTPGYAALEGPATRLGGEDAGATEMDFTPLANNSRLRHFSSIASNRS